MSDGDLIKIKLICSNCSYCAGECNSFVINFLCRFCVEEREFFIGFFTHQNAGNQYETLCENADPDWERHKDMIETKSKITRLYFRCDDPTRDINE